MVLFIVLPVHALHSVFSLMSHRGFQKVAGLVPCDGGRYDGSRTISELSHFKGRTSICAGA